MSQSIPDRQSQEQDNLIKDTNVSGDLIIAPVQIGTKIETQTVQISDAKGTQQPLIKDSPYRGLKRFNDKDRDLFFGRDKLIAELFEMVNRSNLSLVLGASGSGKSSVVRAGLIPELKKSLESQTFYDFIFTPNQDPFDSLHRCLLIEEKDYHFSEAEVEIAREAKADTLTKVIDTLRKDGERWLIFVDQFEELFTICNDLDKRKNFISGLVEVAKSGNSSVKIVLAMRADFLDQLSFYPDLGAIVNENNNMRLVTMMHPDELRQAIEQPAAKHGVVFEEGLVEQIIKELDGQKGYLPLLQYTLKLLWESECQTPGADGRPNIEDRTLNKKSYAALEGVRGALQKRVNEIYKNLNEDEKKITKQIFLKLVNVVDTDSGSRAVSRRAYREEFVKSEEKLLEKFIDKEKLLVSSSEYSSTEEMQASDSKRLKQRPTVEIAHEILLSSWDKLKDWLEKAKEAIIFKNSLAREVESWQKVLSKDESRAKDELLKGTRLDQALEFKKEGAFKKLGGLSLSEQEEKFINASVNWQQQQERQKKNRRRNTVVSLATFSVISLGLASFAGIQLLNVKKAKQSTQEGLIRSAWISLKPLKKSYEECGTWLDYGLRDLYCQIKPFVDYSKLMAISGLLIFKEGGPHTISSLNFEGGYEFGHYNPEFLTWIQEKVVIDPADSIFKQQIQLAYNDKIKVVARAFYQTHKILFATPEGSDEFKTIKSKYQDKIEKQTLEPCYFGGEDQQPEKCGGLYLQEEFRRLGDYLANQNENISEKINGEDNYWYLANVSGGFWVRRSIDGTEQQFFDILTKLLEIYDSEWLDEQNLLDTNPSQLKPRNMIKKMTHDDKLPTK